MSFWREDGDGVVLSLRVQPRSAANRVAGVQGNVLKINLTAPPVEGRANDALVRFLAQRLGVSKSRVRMAGGEASRHKVVRVEGLTPAQVQERLGVGDS